MTNIISTIYKNGVFKPINKINLPENTKVEFTPLRDFSFPISPSDLLEVFRYVQKVYKKNKIILSGLEFQRSIRKEADEKIQFQLNKLQ